MSKQHLTEKDWVTLVLKQKLKMEAELKAVRDSLIEYEKLDGKPKYVESEAALENVRKKAVAARAKNAANKDIGKYLDAVVAEVANSRADLSERQKAMASQANQATAAAARKADTAKEEETGVDQKLIEALVKIAHGAEMQFAACLGKPWAVAVAKPITPQHKAALTERTQGSKRFILGTCVFEDEAHTFVVA